MFCKLFQIISTIKLIFIPWEGLARRCNFADFKWLSNKKRTPQIVLKWNLKRFGCISSGVQSNDLVGMARRPKWGNKIKNLHKFVREQ